MNYRNSKQKEQILQLVNTHGHLSSVQIIESLKDKGVSLATIYRNLIILCKEGKLKVVKVHDIDVYETVKENHYHLQCKICNDIVDVDEKMIRIHLDSALKEDVSEIEVVLIGICPKCKEKRKGD